MNRTRGFTLIELLVVIAIISMLASIVLSSLNTARKKSRDVYRISSIDSIITALDLYYNKNGHYPCSSGELSTSSGFLSSLQDENFLPTGPKDPLNKGVYVYYYSTFKNTPAGPCGMIYQLNYDIEVAGTACVRGGKLLPVGDPNAIHCHIFLPTPLPCSDPYLATSENSLPPDCAALVY